MIKLNNSTIDLILQVEEHTSVQKVFNSLSLFVDEVLIICPILFLQRFIQANHEVIPDHFIDRLGEMTPDYMSLIMEYKGKEFKFNFVITTSETKVVNHPFKGSQEFKVAFKKINI